MYTPVVIEETLMYTPVVIPAQAGIHKYSSPLDSRLRGNDDNAQE